MFRQENATPRCADTRKMWRRDGSSEDDLDNQYNTQSASPTHIDLEDSENQPLISKSPSKIRPSELHFPIGDKTTKIIYNKRNVARKSIARKTKEPRNTLLPQWNIIQDGTITNYTPHTITIDTRLRKNTVIRKNDIAIATETKPLPETQPRLIHMVACKTIGEYCRNQEKIKKFCLEEAKKAKKSSTTVPMRTHPTTNEPQEIPGPSRMPSQQTTSAPKRTRSHFESSNKPKKRNFKKETTNTKWSKEKVLKLATKTKGSNNSQKEAKNQRTNRALQSKALTKKLSRQHSNNHWLPPHGDFLRQHRIRIQTGPSSSSTHQFLNHLRSKYLTSILTYQELLLSKS